VTAILVSLATFVSTALGGLLALRFRDRLHLILSFTAGVLLGVVAFDILPEVFERAHALPRSGSGAMVMLVVGFLLFHALEKYVLVHPVQESAYAHHHHPAVGMLSASALVGHSFIDGVGIGLGYQVSPAVGLTVAIAVIAHDFSDGMNTVSLMLMHHNTRRRTLAMLALDALAPVLGALSTLAFTLPPPALQLYLGFFAGFLLYIGVADILPQAHSRAPARGSLAMLLLTALGTAFVYGVVQASGG
jgi:ZIP family zinc transporter